MRFVYFDFHRYYFGICILCTVEIKRQMEQRKTYNYQDYKGLFVILEGTALQIYR